MNHCVLTKTLHVKWLKCMDFTDNEKITNILFLDQNCGKRDFCKKNIK